MPQYESAGGVIICFRSLSHVPNALFTKPDPFASWSLKQSSPTNDSGSPSMSGTLRVLHMSISPLSISSSFAITALMSVAAE